MLTPEQISGREFLVSLRGYDRDEVHAFLSQVADELGAMQQRVRELEDAAAAWAATPAHAAEPASAEAPAAQQPQALFAEIARETQRVLEAAQEAGDQIRAHARQEAEREVQAARSKAAKLVAEGERRREDIERVVARLEAARGELAGELQTVGRTIEQVLRQLGPQPGVASMREAFSREVVDESRSGRQTRRPDAEAAVAEPSREDLHASAAGEAPHDASAEASDEGSQEVPGEASGDGAGEASGEASGDGAGEASADAGRGPVEQPVAEQPVAEQPVAEQPGTRETGQEPPAQEQLAQGAADAEPPAQEEPAQGAADAEPPAEADASDPLGLRTAVLAPLEPRLHRKIKRGLQDVQNAVLDQLRRGGGRGEAEQYLPGDDDLKVLAELGGELLEEAYLAGHESAQRLAGTPLPAASSGRDVTADFLADTGNHLRAGLAATLKIGIGAGEDLPALSDRVGAVFAELKDLRAEELAAFHLVRAYEYALLDAWTAAGVPARRWMLGREQRCPEGRCRSNDQAGEVRLGESYPSGHDVPPVHVGCTCTTVPAGAA